MVLSDGIFYGGIDAAYMAMSRVSALVSAPTILMPHYHASATNNIFVEIFYE